MRNHTNNTTLLLALILVNVLGIKAELHDSVFNNMMHYAALAATVFYLLALIVERTAGKRDEK